MLRISTLITILLFGMLGANAAILTVNTTADAGVGSLRQAIDDGIANGAANDIVFAIPTSDPGYNAGTNRFTISLESALAPIPVSATTITNAQAQFVTVEGDDTFTIFTLVNSATVVMSNITISRGFGGNGGGIYMGDSGTLTLNNCTISNNAATNLGGGIYVSNSGTLHVHESTFSLNNANYGGAIFPFLGATVNMDTSTLNGNSAVVSGGGIYVEASSTFNATNNTFSGNSAGNHGGAILNQATMTLTSNTITENAAVSGGGIANFGGAATLDNNIVALNTAGTGNDLRGGGGFGNPYTGTYNLIGDADASVGLNTATNMCGTTLSPVDPKIGALAFNGGTTRTHALLFDSPAIDQGNAPGLLTDQRSRTRPFDHATILNAADGSDMGSVEYQLGPSAAPVSISGRIVNGLAKGSSGIMNATIVVTAPGGETWIARSNGFGYFGFTEIPAGGTYLISVTHKRYGFDDQTLNVAGDIEDLTFISN